MSITAPVQISPVLLVPERLRFINPTLPSLEDVLAVYEPSYRSGVITNASVVARFEDTAAERLGVRHCIAVSSCTTGLMLVIRSLGLTGEIIIPSFTFFATGHAAIWNGLRPVFADCDPDTWTISPEDVEQKITGKTSAILGVHLYGNPCNIEALQAIASKHNLKLIFDAAHGFGSKRKGCPIGNFGDAEVFSLSPTKLLVAGEGGIVATNDSTLAHRLRAGRNYGDLGAYDPELIGINARMSEFNAALGLTGLKLLDSKLERRQAIAQLYTDALSEASGVSFQSVAKEDTCSFKDYCVYIDPARFGLTRDEIGADLLRRNIETKRYFYPPLHQQTLYRQYWDSQREPLPNTTRVAGGVLSLPIYESLADETVTTIATAIRGMAQ